MRPGPGAAVRLVESYVTISKAPRPIAEILTAIIEDRGWSSDDEPAQEVAERWHNGFKAHLKRVIEEETNNCRTTIYILNSSNDDHIQGHCFIEPNDDENTRLEKQHRSNIAFYVNEFKKMSPTEFEVLCQKILAFFGAEDAHITRKSADQGIDFFGRVPFGKILKPSVISPGAESQLHIWLAGQAKHYTATQVGTRDIRELVGSVSLAKSKIYAGSKDPLSELRIRMCDPVFFLFFSTGTISRDARQLLQRSGIVVMDQKQLSVFLADNAVGVVSNRFSSETFWSWLGLPLR